MTIDEIRELIRVVQETGILELEVRQGDSNVRIRRAGPSTQEVVVPTMVPVPVAAAAPIMQPASMLPPAEPAPPAAPPTSTASEEQAHDVVVKSPIVGTYYDAPAPTSPPFVKVGDRVEPKQV